MTKLYKIDSKGKTRYWEAEIHEDGKFRTRTGVLGGKEMLSAWTQCEPKNVGKSNSTTSLAEAHDEVASKYVSKRDAGWAGSIALAKKRFLGRPRIGTTLAFHGAEREY